MQNKKDHHYIPQYYLNGFTDSTDPGYIYRYEKGTHDCLKSPLKRVAFEKHLYTRTREDGTKDSNTTENYLHLTVESPAQSILNKLRSQITITKEEKEILSRYIVYLLRRVPRQRLKVQNEIAPKLIPKTQERINQDINQAIVICPDLSEQLESQRVTANEILEKYKTNLPSNIWVEALHHDSKRAVAAMTMMTWLFLVTNENQPFITSDNPVFIDETIGINKEWSEVSIPISKTVALWMSWRQDIHEGFVKTTSQAVKEVNRRTVYRAHRYVFGSKSAQWIITLVNKPHLRLMRLL